jgi:hypothetical protein
LARRLEVAGFAPRIWRRVQVRDCLLHELHAVFEVVMGQKQSPDFVFEGGLPGEHPVSGRPWIPHPSLPLSETLPVDRLPFVFFWTYDTLASGSRHTVAYEACLTAAAGARYPVCVAGERASPPQGHHGSYGFRNFLTMMADPTHPQRDDWLRMEGFDPEVFNVAAVNAELRASFPGKRPAGQAKQVEGRRRRGTQGRGGAGRGTKRRRTAPRSAAGRRPRKYKGIRPRRNN